MGKLSGKVAIITGAASGMGAAGARLFASEGAKVVLADLNQEKGNQIAQEIIRAGGEAAFTGIDLGKDEDCKGVVDFALSRFSTVDIVYNSAAIDISKPVLEYTAEDFRKTMYANVFGTFFVDKYAAQCMIAQGKPGVIVNTGSTCSFRTNPCNALYTTSKGAVLAMTKALALDLAPYNIRVNVLCPGHTKTEMMKGFLALQPDPQQAHDKIAATVPMGRMAQPEEQAKAALFLASDESSYMTGTSLLVDGGLLTYFP